MRQREKQKKEFLTWWNKVGEEIIKKMGNKFDEQKFIEDSDECALSTRKLVAGFFRANQFVKQEKESAHEYPAGYVVRNIKKQIEVIQQLFPHIGSADMSVVRQPLPQHAEGWFAIPQWQTLGTTYSKAVKKVMAMIKLRRNYCDGAGNGFFLNDLRQCNKSVKMWQKLANQQNDNDILIIPAQFGLRHRCHSALRAREVFEVNEFGLGVFAAGIMLLTHPEREVQFDQLHVDCVGDNFSDDKRLGDKSPIFDINYESGMLRLDTHFSDDVYGKYGSASAFLVGNK